MKNIPQSIKSALQLIMLNFSFSANARTSHLLMNQRDQYCIFVGQRKHDGHREWLKNLFDKHSKPYK